MCSSSFFVFVFLAFLTSRGCCLGGNSHSLDELVIRTIKSGAEVNYADENGITPLILASRKGSSSVVAALLQANASLNLKDASGSTAVFAAARASHNEIITLLLTAGADITIPNKENTTVLMMLAQRGNIEILQRLFPSPSSSSSSSTSPRSNSISDCKIVRSSDIRVDVPYVNAKDIDGYAAVTFAANNGHSEVVKILAERACADVNTRAFTTGATPLLSAASNGHYRTFSLLAGPLRADCTASYSDGWSAVMLISKMVDRPDLVELCYRSTAALGQLWTAALLDKASKKNAETALMLASRAGHNATVKMLAEHGAKLNLRQKNSGATALMAAASAGKREVAEILLSRGAEPCLQRFDDESTAADIAKRNGFLQLASLLHCSSTSMYKNKNKSRMTKKKGRNRFGVPQTPSNRIDNLIDLNY